jgi:hypothetical protein
MPAKVLRLAEVFGINRDLPLNYVERRGVDDKLIDNLTRDQDLVIYGSSKQGKTCLRKHCLSDGDYIVLSSQNNMDLRQLHSMLLKEAGYTLQESATKTVDGKAKIDARFSLEVGIPGLGKASASTGGEAGQDEASSTTTKRLELDPNDPNDVILALREINSSKYIVIEDFHYLPVETQQNFAYALKAFHENSRLTFIIVAVWREENRLILFNGDLTGRVIAIDADAWEDYQLMSVISSGEALLNVELGTDFKRRLILSSFRSVYIVQEACHRACADAGAYETRAKLQNISTKKTAEEYVKEIVQEQSGRYKSFLQNFSLGFQTTELEMYKWILFPILLSQIAQLEKGLTYRAIRETIESRHPEGKRLKPGNLTQALQQVSNLQIKKNIKPFVIDYDSSNLLLSIVDKGFLSWLSSQDRSELLELVDIPID